MSNKYYELYMSLRDLIKYIFCRKHCPYCNSKLKRKKQVSILEKGKYSFNGTTYKGEHYSVGMKYFCENCQKIIEKKELLNSNSHKIE